MHIERDGELNLEVYRKPTHTDHQYLLFDSHHPLEHKLGVIRILLQHRAQKHPLRIRREHEHMHTALQNRGYPNWALAKTAKKPSKEMKDDAQKRNNIVIPYVA